MHQREVTIYFERPDLSNMLGELEFRRFSNSKSGILEDLSDMMEELAIPTLSYSINKIEHIENKSVYLQGGIQLKSHILAKVAEHCNEIVSFIATIGSGVEEEVARLTNVNRLSEAYMLDHLGSLNVEHAVNAFHNSMKRRNRAKGYDVTLRFSPGYCDWPITEQKKLFLLLDCETTGITLTESCLMHPRKSISGVFGLFPMDTNQNISPYNPCETCTKRDCNARRRCVE